MILIGVAVKVTGALKQIILFEILEAMTTSCTLIVPVAVTP